MISIIIRTYNNEQFIKQAVESALNQDFSNYEIIVINDGSTDTTDEILDSFNDPKLTVIHQSNHGMLQAGYDGLEQAQGEYIIFLDGDDELAPSALTSLTAGIGDAVFAYSDYTEVNVGEGSQKYVSCSNIFNTLAAGILFHKGSLLKIGFWDTSMIFPEYDLLIRLMAEHKSVHIAEALYVYNRHPNSFTADTERVERGKEELFAKYGEFKFKEY